MKEQTLDLVVTETARFLEKVAVYKEATNDIKRYGSSLVEGKESSAVKRSSMDLTRALADLRLGR